MYLIVTLLFPITIGYNCDPIAAPFPVPDGFICESVPLDWDVPPGDFKRDCPCGSVEHKALREFILCTGCEHLVHRDCMKEYDDSLLHNNYQRAVDSFCRVTASTSSPFFTLCPKCVNLTNHYAGHCCSVVCDDSSPDIASRWMCTMPHLPIPYWHLCIACNKPIHFTCCLYMDRDGISANVRRLWTELPRCLVCAEYKWKNHAHNVPVRDWSPSYPRKGQTELEYPFPMSRILRHRTLMSIEVLPTDELEGEDYHIDGFIKEGLLPRYNI